MMRRVPIAVLAGLLPLVAAACVNPMSERRMLGHASLWFHGVSSAPDSLRFWMASNRRATDVIEEALLGQYRRAPDWFDTATAVYWLSDSGRPEYVPTLLRFAAHDNHDVATYAVYGLARHASDPEVRARLLEVDATAERSVRSNMARVLAIVNDSGARTVLRQISHRDLGPDVIQRMEMALSAPALPARKGPWPCLLDTPRPPAGQCPR